MPELLSLMAVGAAMTVTVQLLLALTSLWVVTLMTEVPAFSAVMTPVLASTRTYSWPWTTVNFRSAAASLPSWAFTFTTGVAVWETPRVIWVVPKAAV